jgi:hypothetical protein
MTDAAVSFPVFEDGNAHAPFDAIAVCEERLLRCVGLDAKPVKDTGRNDRICCT